MAVGALLTTVLTACPQPAPPPPPGFTLTFSYPPQADTTGLTLAAIYFDGPVTPKVLNVYPYQAGNQGQPATTLYVDGYSLKTLASNPGCLTAFKDGEAQGMGEVSVTPADVKTCNLYFLAYRDANGDGQPQKAEEVYMTHDILSNASASFTYSYLSPDGASREIGVRGSGWTLVRHMVLQPEATPGRYQVSMNSLPVSDQAIPIQLHEPSAFFSSMSLPSGGGSR